MTFFSERVEWGEMKSKKRLFEFFREKYGKDLSLKSPGVSNETYGPKSFIYLWDVPKVLGVSRAQLIKDLLSEGFQKPGQWAGGWDSAKNCAVGNGIEIRVSYFKGWHWDE